MFEEHTPWAADSPKPCDQFPKLELEKAVIADPKQKRPMAHWSPDCHSRSESVAWLFVQAATVPSLYISHGTQGMGSHSSDVGQLDLCEPLFRACLFVCVCLCLFALFVKSKAKEGMWTRHLAAPSLATFHKFWQDMGVPAAFWISDSTPNILDSWEFSAMVWKTRLTDSCSEFWNSSVMVPAMLRLESHLIRGYPSWRGILAWRTAVFIQRNRHWCETALCVSSNLCQGLLLDLVVEGGWSTHTYQSKTVTLSLPMTFSFARVKEANPERDFAPQTLVLFARSFSFFLLSLLHLNLVQLFWLWLLSCFLVLIPHPPHLLFLLAPPLPHRTREN